MGTAPIETLDNVRAQCARPHSASLASPLMLSPDMTFSGVCNDSGNLRGDTDEQAAERVIILWHRSHLIPCDVGHVSAATPHFSSF